MTGTEVFIVAYVNVWGNVLVSLQDLPLVMIVRFFPYFLYLCKSNVLVLQMVTVYVTRLKNVFSVKVGRRTLTLLLRYLLL